MPDPLTIDRLLAKSWFSRASSWDALSDFTIDGRRLGAEPYQFTSRSRHETRLKQKQSETFLVGHPLAHLGYREVALESRESPDFCATFLNAADQVTGSIGVEVAELVEPDSARWRNAVESVRIGVRDAVDADPALEAAIRGRFVSISLCHCPNRRAERRLLREILELLRGEALAVECNGRRIVDARFPTLVEHWAHLFVRTFKGAYVDVTASAHSFDPRSLAQVALKVLERKRNKARSYDTRLPLWLILSVTDQRGVFSGSLDLLERVNVVIEPYERVVVYDEGRAVVIDRSGLRRTG